MRNGRRGSIRLESRRAINMDSFLSLLQFADGLFPVGAYAHSFGLEYYVQSGRVNDAAEVEQFLRAYLEGSAAPTDAGGLVCAGGAGKAGDLSACLDLDETLDAMKTVSELRDASRQMGRQTLRVANHLPGHHGVLADFGEAVGNEVTPGNYSVVFGIVGGVMAWPPAEMAAA